MGEQMVLLGVTAVTTIAGWIILLYLRGMRRKIRHHVLRNDDMESYFKRLR